MTAPFPKSFVQAVSIRTGVRAYRGPQAEPLAGPGMTYGNWDFERRQGARRQDLSRAELVRRIAAASGDAGGRRLVYLCAPAGWGKSRLLAELFGLSGRARQGGVEGRARVCLADWDRRDATLAGEVLDGLVRAGLAASGNAGSATATTDPPRAARELAAQINANAAPVYLYLDHADRTLQPDECALLRSLLRRCGRLKIFIASRYPCPELCAPLVVKGEALVLDLNSLSFSADEVDQLSRQVQSSSLLADMLKTVDGWPVAVTHAIETLRTMPGQSPGRVLARYVNDLREFVKVEIISRLDERARATFYQLCLLPLFSRELALSVIRSDDVRADLDLLQSGFGLILASKRQQGWLEIPACIRRLLRTELLESDPAEGADLQRRAFHWLVAGNHLNHALAHVHTVQDLDSVTNVWNERALIDVILRDGPLSFGPFIARMSQTELASHRILAATSALNSLRSSDVDAAQRLRSTACEGLDQPEAFCRRAASMDDDVAAHVYLTEAIIELYLDHVERSHLDAFVDWVIDDDEGHLAKFKGLAFSLRAVKALLTGDTRSASEDARNSIRWYAIVGNQTVSQLYGFVAGALVALGEGRPKEARRYYELAIKQVLEVQSEDHGLICMLHVLEFEIRHELGEPVDAQIVLELLRACEDVERFADNYVRGYSLAIDAAWQQGGFGAAAYAMDEAANAAVRMSIPRLGNRVRCMRASFLAASGDVSEAESQLSKLDHDCDLLGTFQFERFYYLIVKARVCIAGGDLGEAQRILACLDAQSQSQGERCSLMLGLAWSSLLQARGRQAEADELFSSVLTRAAFTGLVAPVLEAGSSIRRLAASALARLRQDPALQKVTSALERLLIQVEANDFHSKIERSLPVELTPQERRVLHLVRKGLPNKVVAYEMDVAETTVKFHLRNIYKKLGVNSRIKAIQIAERAIQAGEKTEG